jgi:hypothetical protein
MINNQSLFVKQYEEKNQYEWDDFVEKSRNGTFLHKINYFHYHKDRFNDCSLLIKKNDQLVALLPGNIENEIYHSHRGLTYGGLITLNETKAEDVLNYFNIINEYLINKKIKKVLYKAIPHIYSNTPAQEDEYALFRLGADLISCGISSAIYRDERVPYSSQRIKSIKRALRYDLEIKIDYSYDDFWRILTNNLMKSHNATPVHSLSEIKKLKTYFDDNIKLYSVYLEGECIAGVVMYITDYVAHPQYTAASERGKKISAVDYLYDYLINNSFNKTKYFDFGVSVENLGQYLNEGLINQKQGFGGRGVLYQQFEYDVKNIIHNKKEN